jgi:DNA polymerase-1
MDKIFIVDAVNFLFRSYYAISPMTNAQGESTNALFGFIRSIYKLINEFSPDYFIAAFDGPENKKSRTEIYSEYKSHREGMPEDLFPQLEKALQFCEIAGIPYLSISGVEADDTMGSIAQWMEKRGVQVYLCSSDKDLCQLVSDHVFIINPHKDNLLIDRKKVKEIFNVYPEQIVDYLAMMGDASDNIPGLEGFGPKTASALLNEFGTLEEVLDHPEKLSGKKKETVVKGREIALMSKKLATIQTNIDFPHEEKFFHLKTPDLEKVKAFYQQMRFLSLLKELGNEEEPTAKSSETATETPQIVNYQLIDDEQSLRELVERLGKEKEICIDTETTNVRPMLADLVGIGLGTHPREAWYVPCNAKLGKAKALSLLKPLLENPRIGFIGHNIKYDLHVLLNEGIPLKKISFDTILASYLISPQTQRHNLDQLSLEKLGKVKIPIEALIGKGKKQITMDAVPLDKITAYCCEDVDYTLKLKKIFEKDLEKFELKELFEQFELPLIPILTQMERNGIFVDLKKLEKMSEELKGKLQELEHKIYHLAGEKFNLNSPKQLSSILFEKMGIKTPKKTTTGFSTAADVLESLKTESPIVKEILEYRTLEKLRSTYVDALPDQVNPHTCRIHCTFNQSVAATGRLSCQNPNLQNIPVRTEEGKKIREAFRPQKAHYSFVSADYSQIELRLLAHLSEDPALLKAFRQGEDIHTYTAALVFGVPLKEVTPHMRYQAKTVNFGIIYGQQAFGLSQQLGIDYHQAEEFIKTYFERYGRVKEFLQFCKESVQKTGRAITLTGRQRPIPEIHNKNPALRAAAERLAINTPLQGTAADLIKMAMIQVAAHLKTHPSQGMMLLQIHDELLFETPDEEAQGLASKVKEIMERIFDLNVPLIVDISIGKNWGEC